jgi:hypothetical protein
MNHEEPANLAIHAAHTLSLALMASKYESQGKTPAWAREAEKTLKKKYKVTAEAFDGVVKERALRRATEKAVLTSRRMKRVSQYEPEYLAQLVAKSEQNAEQDALPIEVQLENAMGRKALKPVSVRK